MPMASHAAMRAPPTPPHQPGGATDRVVELPAAEDVVLGQSIAPPDATRLAHAEPRRAVGDERRCEAGHARTEKIPAALRLLAPEHLAEGQRGSVARVGR